MRMRTAAVLSIVAGAAVALATPGSPGYTFGLYNCGPAAGVSDSAACLQCCRAAYYSGTLQYEEWRDCREFCGDANFAPPPTVPWYFRPILWVFPA